MMNHHYFTNPKYMYGYICLKIKNGYGVFEKIHGFKSTNGEDYGTPLAQGKTVDGAIASAVNVGIKHYFIEVKT